MTSLILSSLLTIKIICIMQLLLIAELFNMLVGHIKAALIIIYKSIYSLIYLYENHKCGLRFLNIQ